jgi:uncharacterized protein (DUF1330 family)
MRMHSGPGLLIAGIAIGAVTVGGLRAQDKEPGAYVVIDIAQITDRDSFMRQLLPKAEPAVADYGGKFLARTEAITRLDGARPLRYVLIAFDSVDKAKSWYTSPAWKEVDDMRKELTKSRIFVVESEDAP